MLGIPGRHPNRRAGPAGGKGSSVLCSSAPQAERRRAGPVPALSPCSPRLVTTEPKDEAAPGQEGARTPVRTRLQPRAPRCPPRRPERGSVVRPARRCPEGALPRNPPEPGSGEGSSGRGVRDRANAEPGGGADRSAGRETVRDRTRAGALLMSSRTARRARCAQHRGHADRVPPGPDFGHTRSRAPRNRLLLGPQKGLGFPQHLPGVSATAQPQLGRNSMAPAERGQEPLGSLRGDRDRSPGPALLLPQPFGCFTKSHPGGVRAVLPPPVPRLPVLIGGAQGAENPSSYCGSGGHPLRHTRSHLTAQVFARIVFIHRVNRSERN